MQTLRKIYQSATIFVLATVATSCSTKSADTDKAALFPIADSTLTKTITKEEDFSRPCSLSNKEFAFEITNCNCGDIRTTSDTIFIELSPANGGEIQGHLLKINYPAYDSSYSLLMKHQNRCWISSMGPDPVLTDWTLYTSPIDAIRYDPKLKGFYIDTIPQKEQEKFPPFDTLDFYTAYKRAIGENLNYAPNVTKGALSRKQSNYKQNARGILERSSTELHRIIFTLTRGKKEEKTIVFTYDHWG
jgi:hypothetical protein